MEKIARLTLACISLQRLFDLENELFQLNKESKEQVIISEPFKFHELKYTDITYRYHDSNEAGFKVGPISISVKAGETLFITGGNGSGKSTLLKLITGLYPCSSGRVELNHKEIDIGCYRSLFSAIFFDAYQDSVPMVMIVTQAPLNQIGKGAFHEIKDQPATIRSIVKWYKRVQCVEEITDAIHHAFLNAFEKRPGPTAIEIPLDVLTQKGHAAIHSSTTPLCLKPDIYSIEKAAQLLINAKKPVIYAGRGTVISSCGDELKDLAEWLEIPCFTTALAKGILPDTHYLNISWGGCKYGMIKTFLQQANVVLVVGSSLDDSDARRFSLRFPDKLIQIDITSENMNRDYNMMVALTGDAKTVLTQLLSVIKQHQKPNHLFTQNTIVHDKKKAIEEKQSTLAWQYMNAIQNAISDQTIIFSDPTWVNGWAVYFLERQFLNTFHCTRNFCGLGFSLISPIDYP